MSTDNLLIADPLALAMTKPTVFMGVPLRLFFGALMAGILTCIDTHSFYGVPLFLFLYLLFYHQSLKDINFLNLYVKWFSKTPPTKNFAYWGKTNSYDRY